MAGVTYRINGKYDGKAVKSAKKDLSDLATVVKGLAVVKVFQKLNDFGNATRDVFVQQNLAMTKFNTAVTKANLNLDKLNNLKTKLSHGNFFDDDSLNNAMTLGIQMGLTEEQLEKVMKASTELQAAGIMPLDQAVKKLSESYSGQLGELGKLAPELKNLSAEELKNGDAVDVMIDKYSGFADAISNTFNGRETQFQNVMSDLKAGFGAIPESFKFIMEGKLIEPLNKITTWLVDNRNAILNFFLNLPSVIKTVVESMGKYFQQLFNEFSLDDIATYFIDSFGEVTKRIVELFKSMGDALKELLGLIGTSLAGHFAEGFLETVQGMFDTLFDMLQNLNLGKKWSNKLIEWQNAINDKFDTGIEKVTKNSSEQQKTLIEQFKKTTKEVSKNTTSVITELEKSFKKLGNDFKLNDTTQAMLEELKEILGKELPEELKLALEGLTFTPVEGDDGNEEKKKEQNRSMYDAGLSASGELGSLIKSGMNGGIWGVIAELLGKLVTRLNEVSATFGWFSNMVTELFKEIISEDSPIIKAIDEFVQPFIDGFNSMKMIFNSVLGVLSGVFQLIGRLFSVLTELLNATAPAVSSILSAFQTVIDIIVAVMDFFEPVTKVIAGALKIISSIVVVIADVIGNILTAIYNAVIWVYNFLVSKRKEKEYKSYASISNDLYDLYNPPTTSLDLSNYAVESAKTTSGSASYTSARDIIVNVNYVQSFVNGDATEIALAIERELKSAHQLGY